MIFRKTILFLLIFSVWFFAIPIVGSEVMQEGTAELTGITVNEIKGFTEIQINSSSPLLSYTIYKPEDPYKIVVELQGVVPGRFTEKMVFDRAGVMEITPSKIEDADAMIRLDITLTVPAEVKPVQKGDGLTLAFLNPESGTGEVVAAAGLQQAEEEKFGEASKENIGVIENIQVTRFDDEVDVLVSGTVAMSPKASYTEGNRLVVDIPYVTTKVESLDAYEPPLLGLRIGQYSDKTRLVFDLMESAEYDITSGANQVMLSFKVPGIKEAKATIPVTEEKALGLAVGEKPSGPSEPRDELFATGKYAGENISLDFQDADLNHIFRLLADVSGYNIVVSPHVKGKFSMKLTNVPWDHALDVILRNYSLSKSVDGNIIRIAPTDEIAREEDAIAKAKEARLKAGDLLTRIYPVNYANVKKVEKIIKDAKILSERGYISIDERTSTIIIKDVENRHPDINGLIKSLDTQTPQVNIEARIVEVTTSFTKELGVQWGTLWNPAGSRTTIKGPSIPGGTGFSSGNPLMVNLPAAVASGAGGAVGIGYITAANTFTLDLQLSAMESSGKGKIISNPRITTMDNEEAKIQQGKKIPYETTSQEGTKTEFVDAALELNVTPHITPDGSIIMSVEAKKNEADFAKTGASGAPTIDTKEAKTQVLVKDGDTLVIGGIFKATTSKSMAGVPGFANVPLLGWLFKKEKEVVDTTELLIFITPRIIKEM